MKKITLLVAFAVSSSCVFAQTNQNYYNFTKSTSTYADLTNPISMNNGQVWDWDDFGPVASPFPITVFGQTYNDFTFGDDSFVLGNLLNTGEGVDISVITAYIMDRDFSFNGPSLSPISYKVEGTTTGSRILKLEVKNAGLEMEEVTSSTSTLYLNYQIWFYESDNSIEFHYGDHNITDVSMLNEDSISYIYLGYMNEANDEIWAGYIDGTIANPAYAETKDENDEPTDLTSLPTPNTVYRFALNPLSVKDTEKVEFNVYPNPVIDILNISFQDNIDKDYVIYDMIGRYVLSGKVDNKNTKQINVSSLQGGSYILKIGGTTKKFIKK